MSANFSSRPGAHETVPYGLPPVEPPSGEFIVRLFLVPGLIVGIIVGALVLFNWLFGGPRTPGTFLQRLDDTNTEIRWRAAADLAQILKRDPNLASDAGFALALAERAEVARAAAQEEELALARRWSSMTPEQATAEAKKLEPERNYLQYLCACLGNFRVPAGVPVLRKLAEQDDGMELTALLARRRQAVWSLADLGQNLRSFDTLKVPDQDVFLARLEQLWLVETRSWTKEAMVRYFEDRRAGRHSALGVDATLARTAEASDPFLRELTALALNFWDGTEAEENQIEATLVRLAHDDGRGTAVTETTQPGAEDSRSVELSPGLRVRCNAVVALARRGSNKLRLDQLDEMLDGARLRGLCVVRQSDGTEQPDEAFVQQTQLAALKAATELRHRRPDMNLESLRPALERLTTAPDPILQTEAKLAYQELAPR